METTPLLKEDGGSEHKTLKVDVRPRVYEASTPRKIVILLCCVILQMLSGGCGYALGVIYVELIRVFNSPRTEAALVQSVYMGIMTAGGLIFTRALTKFGTGPCVITGSFVALVGFVVSSLAVNVPMIIVFTGVVAGFGMCVCYLGAFVTVGWVFHSNAGAPLVLLTVGIAFGQIIFPYVYDALITEYGWRGTFLILGAITLHCAPIGVLFTTSRRFFKIGGDSKGDNKPKILDVSLLKDLVVLLFLQCSFLFSSTINIEMWFIVDIMILRGYARDVGSLMLTIAGIGNCVGRLGGGAIRYYLRFPTIMNWIYAALLVGASHAAVIFLPVYSVTVAAMFIYGIFFGIIAATSPAVMFEASGLERYPQAVALMSLCNGTGNTVGGLLGGLINDATGSYTILFVIAIAVACYISLTAVLIAYSIRRTRRQGYTELKGTEISESVSHKYSNYKGLAMGVIYIVPFIVTSWTFHENPGVPLVIATIGSSIGQFIIPYLFEIFIAEYGWPGAFQLIGGITLNSLPFCVIVYTSRRFYVTGNEETSILKLCDVTLLKDPMVLFILSCCLNIALTGPIESWFFADIMVLRGYERETGSLFVTMTGAGNVIGRAIGAVLRFYVKFPTLYHWVYLCPVIAISHVLVINIFDYWALFGICFLYAIPFGVTVAQVPAIMFEAAGLSRYPRAIALMNLMYGLGNLFGNLLGGFIKDVTGSYDLIFYLGVGSSLYITIATIFVVIIKKCCRLSNTYKSPKIEYRPIDRQETEENENTHIDDQTKFLNVYAGEVKLYDSVKIRPDIVNNPYDNARLTAEFDDVDYDSGDEEHCADNPFDIDTSSIVITYNDSQNRDGTLARSVFSKTL